MEITAAGSTDHGYGGIRPGGLDFARDFDRGLGAADGDDAHRPLGGFLQAPSQRCGGTRTVAGLEPIGVLSNAGHGVDVDPDPKA
jgi:hypothetical protein